MTHPEMPWPKPSKSGQPSKSSWKSLTLPQNSWNIAYEITKPLKANLIRCWDVLTLWDGPHFVDHVSLQINPLLTYHFVSYYWDEASRTWSSLSAETSCVTSAGRPGLLAELRSQPCGFRSQSECTVSKACSVLKTQHQTLQPVSKLLTLLNTQPALHRQC